jgi:hypothetical protein
MFSLHPCLTLIHAAGGNRPESTPPLQPHPTPPPHPLPPTHPTHPPYIHLHTFDAMLILPSLNIKELKIGVWKTIELTRCSKCQREKLKSKVPVKSLRQSNVKCMRHTHLKTHKVHVYPRSLNNNLTLASISYSLRPTFFSASSAAITVESVNLPSNPPPLQPHPLPTHTI